MTSELTRSAMRLLEALAPEGDTVDAYVCNRNEACVRVLGVAKDADGDPLRWQHVSPEGYSPRSDLQWADLTPTEGVQGPAQGSPDGNLVGAILDCLRVRAHSRIFVAQWLGYADANPPRSRLMTFPPRRDSAVWESSVAELLKLERIPMRWWDPDLKWTVGNDIYGRSLFVSGSAVAMQRIEASWLDAFPVAFSDPVGAEDW